MKMQASSGTSRRSASYHSWSKYILWLTVSYRAVKAEEAPLINRKTISSKFKCEKGTLCALTCSSEQSQCRRVIFFFFFPSAHSWLETVWTQSQWRRQYGSGSDGMAQKIWLSPVQTCESSVIAHSFISAPQCRYSSVSNILEANEWNSLVLLVIAPAAVNAARPWSVMAPEPRPLRRTDCFKSHTHWARLFQSSTLFYTWQPWQLQCNTQKKYCFRQYPSPAPLFFITK